MRIASSTKSTDHLLALIREGQPMTLRQQFLLTARLSAPAMMAQLTSIAMQFIDASMVGSLGADPSASIGLMSTTLWLFNGVCSAVTMGFSVQVAHLFGANRMADARNVLRQAITACCLFSLALSVLGCIIAGRLPVWLGGHPAIVPDATRYFTIFMLGMPLLTMQFLAGGMLRCAGNMRVPSVLNVLTCVLDVVFNFLLIFPSRDLTVGGLTMHIPGADMGVTGAACGTICAEVTVTLLMLWYLVCRQPQLRIAYERGSFRPTMAILRKAWHIGFPMGLQHAVMCSAQVLITSIVAPLGSIAIAANAFGITAESLCYMPGFGIGDAATTLVGQSAGAGRTDLMRRFARITVVSGMVVMGVMGIMLYAFAPLIMGLMTPVAEVVTLGAHVLRIEAFAEPLFAASIVCYSVMVGAGDTKVPCWMNIVSIWGVRLTLAAALVGSMGLAGVWTAMCVELCFRGSIFLWRLHGNGWMRRVVNVDHQRSDATTS